MIENSQVSDKQPLSQCSNFGTKRVYCFSRHKAAKPIKKIISFKQLKSNGNLKVSAYLVEQFNWQSLSSFEKGNIKGTTI